MKQSKLEFLVGAFVVLGLAAVAYLTIKLGGGSLLNGDTYALEARFSSVSGLNTGSNVVVAGVPVGRVDGIRVDPQEFTAIVSFRVKSEIQLPTDSMASIKTTGLIGDKYLAISPGADEACFKPGERLTMTESSVDLESLIGKMAFGSVTDDPEKAPPP